jgi:hypothetical protein
MAVILVPDLGGELIQRFARHVTVFALQPVHPRHELVTFLRRERQHALFQFGHTHLRFILPSAHPGFKPGWFVYHRAEAVSHLRAEGASDAVRNLLKLGMRLARQV